jgi:hypothetical protein
MEDEYPIRNLRETVLSNETFLLRRLEFEERRRDGRWQPLRRELYDHGNAAAILPYDPSRGTVLMVRPSSARRRRSWVTASPIRATSSMPS